VCVYLLHFSMFVLYADGRRDWRGRRSLMIAEQNGCRTMVWLFNGQFVTRCAFIEGRC